MQPKPSPLDADRVQRIFFTCLLAPEENEFVFAVGSGIMMTARFNEERLESHRSEITAMLAELPHTFRDQEHGASFLDACKTRHGHLWTGLHQRMDELFMLGSALCLVKPTLPRERWSECPSGMPCYIVTI